MGPAVFAQEGNGVWDPGEGEHVGAFDQPENITFFQYQTQVKNKRWLLISISSLFYIEIFFTHHYSKSTNPLM